MRTGTPEPDEERTQPARPLVALLLLALVALSSATRISVALRDPELDRHSAAGLLKSDPGLLYYITERVVEGGGLPPADFRADHRVAWPALTDLAVEFTVGQELVVAWCQLLTRGAFPLHMTALVAMALCASLALLGAYGLARALTGSRWAGLFAAALWCAMPANYRTVGFLLVREDLSWPLYALHLALLWRAFERPGARAFLAAGVALALALATWHALGFFVAIEAAALVAWLLLTGRNALGARGAGWLLAPVLAAALIVPVLRASGTLLSPAVVLLAALLVAARARGGRLARAGAALAVVALGLALRALFAGALADHAHVYEVLRAKLAHLGQLPEDPRELSFDARLLWQGPFETLRMSWAASYLGLALLGLPAAAWTLFEPREEKGGWTRADSRGVLALCALGSAPAAWLVSRTVILPGLVLPALVALFVAELRRPRARVAIGALLLGLQGLLIVSYARTYVNPWYRPVGRQAELAALVAALPDLVPRGEAVAADFLTSTAILAHTRRPILLTPKYETATSRRRIEELYTCFFEGEPEQLRQLLLGKYRCRHLLVDRYTLGVLSRSLASLRPGEPQRPGSCAALFLSQDEAVLRGVPGYELLYRSPPTILQRDGSPYDLFRLYRLEAR